MTGKLGKIRGSYGLFLPQIKILYTDLDRFRVVPSFQFSDAQRKLDFKNGKIKKGTDPRLHPSLYPLTQATRNQDLFERSARKLVQAAACLR